MLSFERNRVTDGIWELLVVTDYAEFNDFDCGDADLNEYIRGDAEEHKSELLAETYSLKLHENTGGDYPPVAFVSLLNDAIKLKEEKKKEIPEKKRYPLFPAVKIGRLGVKKMFQGVDIGTHLLELIKEMFTTNNRTGCRFLTVDAYNTTNVIKFYKKNGFDFIVPPKPNKLSCQMYFDLKRYLENK